MSTKKRAVSEETAKKAKDALAEINEALLAIKLQTIISCSKHPVDTVSSVIGKNRVTVWRWIRAFKESGIDGLVDKPKGHNPSKLNKEQREQIAAWLKTGENSKGVPTHWTLKKLSLAIEEEYGIKITKTPLWVTIQSMGLRKKAPRQPHAGVDGKKHSTVKSIIK